MITDEQMILASLLDERSQFGTYYTKVVPYIKQEYFAQGSTPALLFKIIKRYTERYSSRPTLSIMNNVITETTHNENDLRQHLSYLRELEAIKVPNNLEYLVDKAESWCKDVALRTTIMLAFSVYEGENKKITREALPDIIKEAVSISFDDTVGHDWDDDINERYEWYHKPSSRVEFNYEILNAITTGGVPRKTFNLIAAGANVGKTLILTILASMYKKLGLNVLYVTNEISKMETASRLDMAITGLSGLDLRILEQSKYMKRIQSLKEGTGKLIIEEFSGNCTSVAIGNLIDSVKIKKGVTIDVVINDYITLTTSSYHKQNEMGNSSAYHEAVAVENRNLAKQRDLIYWSAVQLKGDAMEKTQLSMYDIGMSLGYAKVADLIWAAIRTPQLDAGGYINFQQIKTRYHSVKDVEWQMRVDVERHQLYELDNYIIEGITDRYQNLKNKQQATLIVDQPNETATAASKPANKITSESILTEGDDGDDEYSSLL